MRVHLARALANAPELLLLEHPTARLEAEEGAALGHLVRSLVSAEGLAVLALTIDEDFAEAVATRVLRPDPRTGRVAPSGWRFWKR
jgi:ABC-type lipoprotein export system ATPase subunit